MASESKIQRDIRVKVSSLGCPFLRYNVGTFLTMQGNPISIGEKGVSDLIGLIPHTITAEDVGRTVGVFAAFEVKKEGGSTAKSRRESQGAFLRTINRLGGLGAIVKSPEDAEAVIKDKWNCNFVIDYKPEQG